MIRNSFAVLAPLSAVPGTGHCQRQDAGWPGQISDGFGAALSSTAVNEFCSLCWLPQHGDSLRREIVSLS